MQSSTSYLIKCNFTVLNQQRLHTFGVFIVIPMSLYTYIRTTCAGMYVCGYLCVECEECVVWHNTHELISIWFGLVLVWQCSQSIRSIPSGWTSNTHINYKLCICRDHYIHKTTAWNNGAPPFSLPIYLFTWWKTSVNQNRSFTYTHVDVLDVAAMSWFVRTVLQLRADVTYMDSSAAHTMSSCKDVQHIPGNNSG